MAQGAGDADIASRRGRISAKHGFQFTIMMFVESTIYTSQLVDVMRAMEFRYYYMTL